jgi:hypothetical protein
LPIPPSSGYTAIGLAIAALITVVLKYKAIPAKYHHLVPNWYGTCIFVFSWTLLSDKDKLRSAMGIGFLLNATTYPTAMVIGSTVAYIWKTRSKASYVMYCYAVAAGFIAGEGLGGIVNAILTIAGVGGSKYGTSVSRVCAQDSLQRAR